MTRRQRHFKFLNVTDVVHWCEGKGKAEEGDNQEETSLNRSETMSRKGWTRERGKKGTRGR